MARLPSVTLVIPSHNGSCFLPECLDSVAQLDYPRELIETIVVDNGSTDGTEALLASTYPWVRVLRQAENLGFAEAVNVGARASTADCLALANNDMRLDSAWLRELVDAYEPEEDYRCVGGLIVNLDGERVDFAEGYVSFRGMAGQIGQGQLVRDLPLVDRREVLFACGGSLLLVDRELFLDLGGFDPTFFAYFEDVDFGWRLSLAGHKVRLAPRARSFHHRHGTGLMVPRHQRVVLQERNALLMLVKNVDEPDLYRLLAAAVCLVSERARLSSLTDPREFEFGVPVAGDRRDVPFKALAHLYGVAGFVAGLEDALAKREQVQALRRRSNDEIFALFQRPFRPIYAEASYLEASATLARAFDIVGRFPERRLTRLLYVREGSADRGDDFVRAVAGFVAVVPDEPPEQLKALVRECDVVLVEAGAPAALRAAALAKGVRRLVVDLVDSQPPDVLSLAREADLLLCATEESRAAWAAATERAVHVVPTADPDDPLRSLRLLVEEPSSLGLAPATTEDLQLLAALRRAPPEAEPEASRPGLARMAAQRLPPPLRRRLARLRGIVAR
jgi:GT2 family glycosyltransferase